MTWTSLCGLRWLLGLAEASRAFFKIIIIIMKCVLKKKLTCARGVLPILDES